MNNYKRDTNSESSLALNTLVKSVNVGNLKDNQESIENNNIHKVHSCLPEF